MKPSAGKYRFYAYIPPKVKDSVFRKFESGTSINDLVIETGISYHHIDRILEEKITPGYGRKLEIKK